MGSSRMAADSAVFPTMLFLVLVVINLCLAGEDMRGDVPRKVLENGDGITTSTPTRPCPYRWDLPSIDLPSIDLSSVDLPSIDLPSIDLPSIDLPHVDLPDWDISSVDVPDLPDWHVDNPHFGISFEVQASMDGGIADWWTGLNVCVTREETEDDDEGRVHFFQSSTECDQTDTMYKCVTILHVLGKHKKRTVIHQCCHGFEREGRKAGCTKRLELSDPFTTAEKLGSGQFATALRRIGMADVGRENYTLFAPTDKAFREEGLIQDVDTLVVMASPDQRRIAENVVETLRSHVVPGIHRTSSLNDEQLLDTVVSGNRIRINFYDTPRRVVMANCVPLNSTDNFATSGVIHTVNKILHPVKSSLFDLISQRPEFSILLQFVLKSGLDSLLRHEGQYTLFAPTNEAFEKLNPNLRENVLNGENCLTDVLRGHLLPNVICSEAIVGRMRSCNALGECMNLTSDGHGGVTVGEVPLVLRDLMATNGVLHSIDEVLIPDAAFDVAHVAKKVGATQFLDLVEDTDLSKTLQSLQNFTVFLPTNQAVQSMPEEMSTELDGDRQILGNVIKYHIVPVERRHCDLHNDLELATLDSSAKKLLIKEYAKFSFPWARERVATVQCAVILHTDFSACGGVVHLIDKVLVPPAGNVMHLLSHDGRFSRLVEMLWKANLIGELADLGPLTFFAPTNEAFEKLPASIVNGPLSDPEKLRSILKHHMVHDILCCSGIFYGRGSRQHTLDGSTVRVHRRRHGAYIDDVLVSECDLVADGGVVHALNSLLPRSLPVYARSAWRRHHYRKRGRLFGQRRSNGWPHRQPNGWAFDTDRKK